MLSIFSCVYWPCICLLWRNVCLGLLLIFDWAICFFWYWGVWNSLENNPLSVASFANIFSHSEGCLLILYIVSLPCKSFIVLIRSHLELLWWFSVGMTQRARMGREEGGVFRMGNTCKSMADSCQCMANSLQYCKVISLQLIKINGGKSVLKWKLFWILIFKHYFHCLNFSFLFLVLMQYLTWLKHPVKH